MENNLIASIFEANDRIQQCINQPLILPLNEVDIAEKVATENASGRQNQIMSLEQIEYEYEERYIVSIIGARQQKNDSFVSKSVYIAYEISITRISDGYTKSVLRRFRDIRALYHELVMMDEDIGNNPNIIFPDYSESWFGPSQVSPESDLVQRRKSDLQAFFFQLFHQYPILFYHMKIIEFLELKSMPPKSHSTFSTYFVNKADVDVDVSEDLNSDWVYNRNTGRMENMKGISTPVYINNPSCVDFLNHSEKFKSQRS